MVDPNNIKFDTMIDFNGQGQKMIGMVIDNEFFFSNFKTGYGCVSSVGHYTKMMLEALKRKTKCFIYLKDILLDAGFQLVSFDDEVPDIDFTNLEKDTLISLLSEDE